MGSPSLYAMGDRISDGRTEVPKLAYKINLLSGLPVLEFIFNVGFKFQIHRRL